MRVLPKQEIDVLKAQERQVEVNEGLKLAKKVDALRETVAKEQANLFKFRDETLKAVNREVAFATHRKSELLNDIEELEERKRRALEPLTTELNNLQETKALMEEQSQRLQTWSKGLESQDYAYQKREHEIAKEELLLSDERSRYDSELSLLDTARKDHEEARNSLQTAQKAFNEEMTDAEKATVLKSLELAVKERNVELGWIAIGAKEADLVTRETRLADQRETIARIVVRIKKKHPETKL